MPVLGLALYGEQIRSWEDAGKTDQVIKKHLMPLFKPKKKIKELWASSKISIPTLLETNLPTADLLFELLQTFNKETARELNDIVEKIAKHKNADQRCKNLIMSNDIFERTRQYI